jgi:hypothetical protein
MELTKKLKRHHHICREIKEKVGARNCVVLLDIKQVKTPDKLWRIYKTVSLNVLLLATPVGA